MVFDVKLRSSPFRLYWPLSLEVCLSLPRCGGPHSNHHARLPALQPPTKLLCPFSVAHAFLNRFLRRPRFLVQMPKDVYSVWSCSFFCGISKMVSHSAFFCFPELIPKWSLKGNMNSWLWKIPYYNSNTCVPELNSNQKLNTGLYPDSLWCLCVFRILLKGLSEGVRNRKHWLYESYQVFFF